MERKCKVCGSVLIKRKFESKKKYSKKQFCTTQCARQYFKKNKIGWWSDKSDADYTPPHTFEYDNLDDI